MNLPEITKLVFVSVISKQIKLDICNSFFWMCCPLPEFITFFVVSSMPGTIQTQYTSAQEMFTELDNVSKI